MDEDMDRPQGQDAVEYHEDSDRCEEREGRLTREATRTVGKCSYWHEDSGRQVIRDGNKHKQTRGQNA